MSDDLPGDWRTAREHEEHDELLDEQYRAVKYEHEAADLELFVSRVEEPKDRGGWGYEVYARSEPGAEAEEEQLGIADDFEAATERAREFMREHGK